MANRLAKEQSPYLLQHQDNPVDWWAWSQEAFDAARAQDKPVFLSIGYSTCHWCHVMEHESFEDLEVARLMNETFINIKVDREERPDIDAIYMTVCQMITGSGGWPLTILMTPERKPFSAATYIPKRSRYGRVGMLEFIPRVRAAWRDERARVGGDAEALTAALARALTLDTSGAAPDLSTLRQAYAALRERFDPTHGGFGTAPKFPSPHSLLFLLRYWKRTQESEALHMVEVTLRHMRRGGIYDHVGYGFHRYSTDREWKLPHFEKMLYDQAMLVLAYTEAYQATGAAAFKRTASEVIAYVLRDMTSEEGGFYSAEDADSEGREGKFYLWRRAELTEVLGETLAAKAARVFHVEQEGNFVDESARVRTGENVLFLSEGESEDLEEARRRLHAHRATRVRPGRDDKVLTDWNGLMIAALARAGRVLEDADYVQAARRAAEFARARLSIAHGRLLHRYRKGQAAIDGMLDDYAFLIWGLTELYESTFEADYLALALVINRACMEHFLEGGAFYVTPDDGEPLLVRPRQAYDGAIPSGNSVMMMNLLRLGRLTGDAELEQAAQEVACFFAKALTSSPSGYTAMLSALDAGLGPSSEVVVAGDPEAADTQAMLRALHQIALSDTVVLLRPDTGGEELPPIARLVPAIAHYRSLGGAATAYVCRALQCQEPTTDIATMRRLLADQVINE